MRYTDLNKSHISRATFYRIQTVRFLLVMILVTYTFMSLFIWSIVPSSSMEPTLNIGTYCFVRQTKDVGFGDIVCFFPYHEPPAHISVLYLFNVKIKKKTMYVKRVIGLPGDIIEIRDGKLYRNGEVLDEDYIKESNIARDFGPIIVSDGTLFLMGDNRNNSKDSRVFGPIPYEKVVGRVFMHFTPLNFSN